MVRTCPQNGEKSLPNEILYSNLCEGSHKIGKPNVRFKDTVKPNLKAEKVLIGSWQMHNKHRDIWRKMIRRVQSSSEPTDSKSFN